MATTTTASGLEQTMQIYYDKRGLTRLRKSLYFANFGIQKPIPAKSGKQVSLFRYDNIASSTSALTEATVPAEVQLSANTTLVTVSQYGRWIKVSDQIVVTHRTDVMDDAVENLTEAGAESIDTLIYNELVSNATNHYANFKAVGTLQNSDVMNAIELRRIRRKFRAVNAKPFKDGRAFVFVCDSAQMYDLEGDDNADGFLEASKYVNPQNILDAEVGKLHGVRVLESNIVSTATGGSLSSGVTAHQGVAISRESFACAKVSALPFEIIVKQVGSAGADDPLNQYGSIGYKFSFAAKYLGTDQTRALVVNTGATVDA